MIMFILIRNQVLDYIEVGLIFSWDTNDLFGISRKSYMEIWDCCILENIKNIWKFLHFSSHLSFARNSSSD